MTILTLQIENDNLLDKILDTIKKFNVKFEIEKLDEKEKKELFDILEKDKFISIEEFAKKHNLWK